jgi:hypothetical protein
MRIDYEWGGVGLQGNQETIDTGIVERWLHWERYGLEIALHIKNGDESDTFETGGNNQMLSLIVECIGYKGWWTDPICQGLS